MKIFHDETSFCLDDRKKWGLLLPLRRPFLLFPDRLFRLTG
jgi:hypothetical protein